MSETDILIEIRDFDEGEIARLTSQIQDLCDDLGVRMFQQVYPEPNDPTPLGMAAEAEGDFGKFILLTRPIADSFSYAVALHELGHCAVGADEDAAWEWADEHAIAPTFHLPGITSEEAPPFRQLEEVD